MSKYKAGDIVNVRCAVAYDQAEDYVFCRDINRLHSEPFLAVPDSVTLIHHGFKLDDVVLVEDVKDAGTIRAIVKDHAMVEFADGSFTTAHLEELSHFAESAE